MADGKDDTTVIESDVIDASGEESTAAAKVDETTEAEATGADATEAPANPTAADEGGADSAEHGSTSDEDDSDEDDSDDEDSDNPLDVEGEIAADYLEELLDIADLDGDIDTYVENGRAHVSVITESDVLVGPDGEVLEALQELSRLAVITETGNRSRLMLDIGGFRDQRRKALTELASDAVEEVKSTGESVRLKPMNPFERKIVHDVVAGAGLTSESEGEEPQRRVVILPAR